MVLSALLDLLHSLDVQVVVNGVETKEQLQWLNSWPDALVQGFLLSRPKAGAGQCAGAKPRIVTHGQDVT